MKTVTFKSGLNRREFCKIFSAGSVAASLSPMMIKSLCAQENSKTEKPVTNINDALSIPRNRNSMPGKYPGQVSEIFHSKSVVNNKPDFSTVSKMLETGMRELTGESSINKAWLQFVSPEDIIGLKVNPVAGKLLSTSLEITQTVIQQLENAGIPRKNIVIWDRREFQLHEVGFTDKNFPGIEIVGTERQDQEGSFYDKNGQLYSTDMIDRDRYYWADCQMEYDKETLPYMVNEGKYSYFTKIAAQRVSKIINIPILKNAGSSVTLCLKNLAYGTITNTARLHKQLWAETCAQVPCFTPLRDKVVLNIVDGIRGCYDGGPGAKPQFFTNYQTLLVGTDPVAVDRMGYEIVLKKRLEEKIQKEESPKALRFMEMAQEYQLGVADKNRIQHQRIVLG